MSRTNYQFSLTRVARKKAISYPAKGKHLKMNLVSVILKKVARKIGALVVLDPEYGFAGQVTYKSGVKRYFRASSLDLNPLGSSEIAKDKDYANFFMRKMGYPGINGKTFFSDDFSEWIRSDRDIHAAYRYAQSIGFPVIVKPNSKSQGQCVAKVYNMRDFYRCMREIFKKDRVALVQEVATGKDYRVVVLDDAVISAYERVPLEVTGDGKSTIRELLEVKQRLFEKTGRDTQLKIDDYRLTLNLRRHKLSFESVPRRGERLALLDNANLSSGGDSRDVTGSVHPEFKKVAIELTRNMGLRLCGVDFMIQGDISETVGTYWIIEINSAPGLDNYSSIGSRQAKIVEDLYLEVLKAME